MEKYYIKTFHSRQDHLTFLWNSLGNVFQQDCRTAVLVEYKYPTFPLKLWDWNQPTKCSNNSYQKNRTKQKTEKKPQTKPNWRRTWFCSYQLLNDRAKGRRNRCREESPLIKASSCLECKIKYFVTMDVSKHLRVSSSTSVQGVILPAGKRKLHYVRAGPVATDIREA